MYPSLLLASLVFAAPTYREVAPVLQRRCCGCHQKGLAAPMALDNYAEAASWSASIREAVASRRMPPWHADPKIGRWANDRSLTEGERETLLGWIDAGCPDGPAKPSATVLSTGWRIKPDVVVELPAPQSIPASGVIPYRFIPTPTGFTEDRWVSAIEVRPGNRKTVHHILLFAPVPGSDGATDPSKVAIIDGMLASYLPGDEPLVLPPGYAKRIAKGMPLVFQIHYTATGKPESDRSSVGLVFAKEPPTHEVKSLEVEAKYFTIPTGTANFRQEATRGFNYDVELLALTPHMHLLGKDFAFDVTRPKGRAETVLSVPRYDFNWQTAYRPAEPILLPGGSFIECVAHYDNSAANPASSGKDVVYGEQTDQEMMIGFVEYVERRDSMKAQRPPQPTALSELPVAPPARPWRPSAWWLAIVPALIGGVLAARRVRRRKPPVAR